jgi:hypothetical protein
MLLLYYGTGSREVQLVRQKNSNRLGTRKEPRCSLSPDGWVAGTRSNLAEHAV